MTLGLVLFSMPAAIADIKPHQESQELAREVPIADLHFHPRTRIKPSEARQWMDKNGVRWAGGGATSKAALLAAKGKSGKPAEENERILWQSYKEYLGDRFIAFAGQSEMIHAYAEGGTEAIEDVNNPRFQKLITEAERDLEAGIVKGIGEMFVNNKRSTKIKNFRRKSRADAPTIVMLFDLVSRYDSTLTIHMDSDSDSLDQLSKLLQTNLSGRLLWNHCGMYIEPSELKSFLSRYPNLYCELAYRYPPMNGKKRRHINVFDGSGPKEDWLMLIEEFPDRFMIGTDAKDEKTYSESIDNVRKGLFPYLKPDTLRKVAYENAKRIFVLQ